MKKRLGRWRFLALLVGVGFVTFPLGVAYADHGTQHAAHTGWPAKPNGLTQITNTFGQPCNSEANDNGGYRTDDVTGEGWWVYFHKKLGPAGGANTLTSAWWHVSNEAPGQEKSGIFGYNCRYIAGTTTWSTHAWGIAVDTNTVANHPWERHCHIHDLGSNLRNAYTSHGFGEISCDAGHFQYASGY